MWMTMDESECAQNLSLEPRGVSMIITNCGTKMRAGSVHVRHAIVEVQVQCVNVVIGVLVVLLVVVRVVPIFLVVILQFHSLVLIAIFHVAIFHICFAVLEV